MYDNLDSDAQDPDVIIKIDIKEAIQARMAARAQNTEVTQEWVVKAIKKNYEAYYDIHYPGEERASARGENKSPIYDWHKENGAVFGEKAAWERVNYYLKATEKDLDQSLQPNGWVGKHWSAAVALEHHATRNSAGLFDGLPKIAAFI